MDSKERVDLTLRHKEPDRIPFDLGGTVLTGISITAYGLLRDYLGLGKKGEDHDVAVFDLVQQLAYVDHDVADLLRVDVRPLLPGVPRGRQHVVGEEGDYYTFTDEFGICWRKPKGNGFYFDMVYHPMSEFTSVDEVLSYHFPDPWDENRFFGMRRQAQDLDSDGKVFVTGGFCAGILEMALWSRGFEEFFTDLSINQGFAETLLDIFTEMKMKYWEKAVKSLGPGHGILIIPEADDLASQQSLLISPATYRRFIKPRHKRLFDFIRSTAGREVKIFYHCCGAVRELIPDLIEEGVDILNPVQISAKGMDPFELKRDFGNDLTFWGGGVDTQRILPYGTPAEVRDNVKRCLDALAPGGGFVFATVHNIQADVRPENIMAMWDELRQSGVY